ncbi:Tbc2 translation factor, chloroplastic [Porphyridium purpureum]|uniref:Tbc2 translation factor, chloroplastic n=1 Tax=Porphyridium purpureum TaxID=35688 RepID=A0A5J4YWG0_PORPP|nr:Tbc2 translation factor, chloroplastic [Porphyridium purpureum]|eukprot:POR3100..scf209_3
MLAHETEAPRRCAEKQTSSRALSMFAAHHGAGAVRTQEREAWGASEWVCAALDGTHGRSSRWRRCKCVAQMTAHRTRRQDSGHAREDTLPDESASNAQVREAERYAARLQHRKTVPSRASAQPDGGPKTPTSVPSSAPLAERPKPGPGKPLPVQARLRRLELSLAKLARASPQTRQRFLDAVMEMVHDPKINIVGLAWLLRLVAKYAQDVPSGGRDRTRIGRASTHKGSSSGSLDCFMNQDQFFAAWKLKAMDQMRSDAPMDGKTISSLLHSISILRIGAHDEFATLALNLAVKMQHDVSLQSLGAIYASLAKMNIKPSRQQLKALTHRLVKDSADAGNARPDSQALTNIAWALAKFECKLSPDTCHALLAHFERALPEARPENLSIFMWSLAKLSVQPAEPFLAAWETRFIQVAGQVLPQNLANCVWALGSLRLQPSRKFMDAWFSSFEARYAKFSEQHLANIVWGLARLDMKPGKDFWLLWFSRASLCMGVEPHKPQHLSMSLWGMAKLDVKPGLRYQKIMSQYLNDIISSPALQPQHATNILWALARLDLPVSDEFARRWMQRFCELTRGFSLQNLANTLWALGRLKIEPSGELMNAWYIAFEKQVADQRQVSPLALSSIIYGFSRLGVSPCERFLDSWFGVGEATLSEWNPRMLANSLWALAKLGVFPHDEFLEKWLGTFEGHLSECSAQHIANVLWSYGTLGVICPGEHLHKCLDSLIPRLSIATHEEASGALWAFGELKTKGAVFDTARLKPVVAAYLQQVPYTSGANPKVERALALLGFNPNYRTSARHCGVWETCLAFPSVRTRWTRVRTGWTCCRVRVSATAKQYRIHLSRNRTRGRRKTGVDLARAPAICQVVYSGEVLGRLPGLQ